MYSSSLLEQMPICTRLTFAAPPPSKHALVPQVYSSTLQDQAQVCRELLEMEQELALQDGAQDRSGEKWPRLTLARLLDMQHELDPECKDHSEEAQQLYTDLIEIDPLRKGFYLDARQGKAHVALKAL